MNHGSPDGNNIDKIKKACKKQLAVDRVISGQLF